MKLSDRKREAIRDPRVRLLLAWENGVGCRLSWGELESLVLDHAVETAALNRLHDLGLKVEDGKLADDLEP